MSHEVDNMLDWHARSRQKHGSKIFYQFMFPGFKYGGCNKEGSGEVRSKTN